MVLIISSQKYLTTQIIVEWLQTVNINFKVVYQEAISNLQQLYLSNNVTFLTINNISLENVTVIWHRRGRFQLCNATQLAGSNLSNYLREEERS